MSVAQLFVNCFYVYLLIGFLFGLWFVLRRANQLDENMRTARWAVRLLLLPGAALFWPILLIQRLRNPYKQTDSGSTNLKPR